MSFRCIDLRKHWAWRTPARSQRFFTATVVLGTAGIAAWTAAWSLL